MVEKVSTRSVGMRYGLFLGAFGIVSFLVTTLSGVNVTDGSGAWVNRIISIIVTAFIFYLAHEYFKKNGDGFMSFGQGVGVGFWASLISSLISSSFLYIYVKFIDSSFIDMIKDKQIEAMQKQGMSDDKIEAAMKIAGMFTSAEVIAIFGILGGIFFGVIIALLVSIFTQKKNPDAAIS